MQRHDEWPNLSEIDARSERPKFPDGDFVSPISVPPSSSSTVSVLVFALMLLWLCGAFVKACTEIANQPDAAAETR